MTVALCVLALREESLRDHQVEIVPSACHRDIEEAPCRAAACSSSPTGG